MAGQHLGTARATGRPGSDFRYENGNVEAVAAVLRKITGLSTSALLSELLWSRIGAEEDAYYVVVDAEGTEAACGGFSATLRDIARLGELLRCGGALGDQQIVPEEVATGIVTGVPDGPVRGVRSPRTPQARDVPVSTGTALRPGVPADRPPPERGSLTGPLTRAKRPPEGSGGRFGGSGARADQTWSAFSSAEQQVLTSRRVTTYGSTFAFGRRSSM